MATAILIVPGAQAVDIGKPTLYNEGGQNPEYSPGVTIDVTFNSPDLVSLAGLVLHFECSASGSFSEAMAIAIGAQSAHAKLVDIGDTTQSGYGYNRGGQSGYGYTAGEHGGYTANRDVVDFGGYGYSSGNGYSYGYDSGYGYGYTSGTLTFSFEWIQSAFVALEECTLVLEVVPKGRTTGDFESPRSDVFVPRVPPTANAGADIVSVPGATVTLDGGLSIDLNNGPGPLSFEWTQAAGVAVSGFTDLDTEAPQFVVPAALDQVLTFNLNVSDTLDEDADTVNVDVRLVAAPADVAVLEGTQLTLNAQAADFAGLTFLWTLQSGLPTPFANPTDLVTSVVLPEVDADTPVTLRITATQGTLVRFDEITILVRDNEAPTVDAGVEVAVVSGTPAVLLGASAVDPETTDTLTYSWSQLSGPTVSLQGANTLAPTVVAPPVASATAATLVLTASDGKGGVGKDVRHLIIQPNAVYASAGPDIGVVEGSNVTLSGASSRGATSYQWTLPAGITATSPLNQVELTFVAPQVAGAPVAYNFSLQVNGAGVADVVKVTVHDTPAGGPQDWYLHTGGCLLVGLNPVPLLSDTASTTAGDDPACLRAAVPVLGTPVDFDATSSSALPAGSQVSGELHLTVLLPASSEPLLPVPGFGAVPVQVDLMVGGVSIGKQAFDAEVDTLLFDLDPTGLPGSLPGLPLGFVAKPVSFTTSAPLPAQTAFAFRVTVGTTVPGLVYAIGVEDGAASVFHFPGVAGGSALPTATATAPASAPEASQVQLGATGSTGTGLTYHWLQTSGPLVALSSASVAQPTFTAPPVLANDVVTFLLTVRADSGLTANDTVAITIENVPFQNVPPVANAGADRFATPGTTVVLEGGMSDANPIDFTFGRWTQPSGLAVGGSATGPAGGSRATRSFVVPDVAEGTTFTFQWTVRDNHGLTNSVHTDDVTVTVGSSDSPQPIHEPQQPPQPPPAGPGQNPSGPTPGGSNNGGSPGTSPGSGTGTTPDANLDSDGDGIPDHIELLCSSDPLDAESVCNFDITALLKVTRKNGVNQLDWTGLSFASGYQLWSSNSPYVLLATVEGAGNTTYTHDTPSAKQTTKYKLTFFVEKTKAGGYLSDASQLDSLPGWDESRASTSSLGDEVVKAAKQFPWWGYLLMVLVAGLVLVSITFYARFERQKK